MVRVAEREKLTRIGNYQLLGKVAHGGMSTVYTGIAPDSGEVVAVKIIAEEQASNPVWRKRFEQEYHIARKIRHRHLVRSLDFGEDNGRRYLVMEYIDGPSLADVIEKEERLPEEEALRIIGQVAQALEQAHRRGVLHRDVKPGNILLDDDRQAKLTDLGLGKDLGADLDLTRPLVGLGTVNFMAPEQFDDAKTVDQRCDVYALAATLYYALTGRMPFDGRNDLHVLSKKIKRDLTPIREVGQVSPRIERAVLEALHPQRDKRPATCAQFLARLAADSSEHGNSFRAPTPTRLVRSERRATVRYPSGLNSACRPVGDEEGRYWFARAHDISAGGINLIMRRRFEPGTVLTVELQDKVGRPKRLTLVRVIRVQARADKRWTLGCVFDTEMCEEDVRALE
jgi:serine/threonine protein kinase